jgi:hypothetical protein
MFLFQFSILTSHRLQASQERSCIKWQHGTITIQGHKSTISPQNHYQDLNNHYVSQVNDSLFLYSYFKYSDFFNQSDCDCLQF